MDLESRHRRLKEIVGSLGPVLVTFSGGVDSTFLLKTCSDLLGPGHVLAMIASSPVMPERELYQALDIAGSMGVEHLVVDTAAMDIPEFTRNSRDRCYHCKLNLLGRAWGIAKDRGLESVLEGSNMDDMADFRPGRKACEEKGVVSPLLLAKLTKADVRVLSKGLGLPTWDKPSFACLATRIPYGTPIDREVLTRIERSENFLRDCGLKDVRVRAHHTIARVEVAEKDMDCLLALREEVAATLQGFGFIYVTLDLRGYRMGSLNETAGDAPPDPEPRV
jgi:uncharacterized protein